MPQPLTEESDPLNTLYCGEGGTGKSSNLATMAAYGRVFAVNAESGIKGRALRRLSRLLGIRIPIENIEIFPGQGEKLTYDSLDEQYRRIAEALARNPRAYAGVFWDSITEIQQIFKDQEQAAAEVRAQRAGRSRGAFVMDQDNWRTVNEQCRKLIRQHCALPCHFGMSALLRREQDNDGVVAYQPAVTPGLQNDLIGWMDLVCVTFTDEVAGEEEYRGLFRPHGKFRGKDRFKILPRYVIDPTFTRLVDYVDEVLVASRDPIMIAAKQRREAEAAAQAEAEAA